MRSCKSILPLSSLATTTTFMPHIEAEAGLVPVEKEYSKWNGKDLQGEEGNRGKIKVKER